MIRRMTGFVGALILLTVLSACDRQVGSRQNLSRAVGTVERTDATEDASNQLKPHQQPKVVGADPAWFACQKAEDCIVVEGPCQEPQALNKLFLQPFKSYREQMNRMIECSLSQKPVKTRQPQCVKNRCALNQ